MKTLMRMESEFTRQELERKTNSQTSYPIAGEKVEIFYLRIKDFRKI